MSWQTIYHQGVAAKYLGADVRATWQTGEASVIAERLRVPVVSDFRPADLAAGGQGAPLVPMLDFCMFRDATKTAAAESGRHRERICDTGWVRGGRSARVRYRAGKHGHRRSDAEALRTCYDRDGTSASRGRVLDDVVAKFCRGRYFPAPPPKSCGREEFGAALLHALLQRASERALASRT